MSVSEIIKLLQNLIRYTEFSRDMLMGQFPPDMIKEYKKQRNSEIQALHSAIEIVKKYQRKKLAESGEIQTKTVAEAIAKLLHEGYELNFRKSYRLDAIEILLSKETLHHVAVLHGFSELPYSPDEVLEHKLTSMHRRLNRLLWEEQNEKND